MKLKCYYLEINAITIAFDSGKYILSHSNVIQSCTGTKFLYLTILFIHQDLKKHSSFSDPHQFHRHRQQFLHISFDNNCCTLQHNSKCLLYKVNREPQLVICPLIHPQIMHSPHTMDNKYENDILHFWICCNIGQLLIKYLLSLNILWFSIILCCLILFIHQNVI